MAIKIESSLSVTNSGTLLGHEPDHGLSVGELTRRLELMFPPHDAEKWDRTGLLVGDPSEGVTGVSVALDPTPKAVELAQSSGSNVLLTHHPVFLNPPDRIGPMGQGFGLAGATVYEAVKRGVALVNFHTALDVSAQAREMLPGMLRLAVSGVLEPMPHDSDRGYGQVCTLPEGEGLVTLERLGARCTAVFGRAPRIWGDMDRVLSTVVTWTGSASAALDECLTRSIDALVCGEVKYHDALAASEAGLCIVELGHDVSELPFANVLGAAAIRAGVPHDRVFHISQQGNWCHPEAVRA